MVAFKLLQLIVQSRTRGWGNHVRIVIEILRRHRGNDLGRPDVKAKATAQDDEELSHVVISRGSLSPRPISGNYKTGLILE
jgi:hypothetical protein